MRIGLNAQLLSWGPTYRGAGISRYIRNLISALLEVSEHELVVFLGDRRVPRAWAEHPRLNVVLTHLPTVKPMVRILWEQLIQPLETSRRRLDVLHSLGYVRPFATSLPAAVTAYDLSFLVYPEAFNLPNRLYLRWFTRWSVRSAQRVLAISESTKADLIRILGVRPERIAVALPGVESSFAPVADAAALDAFRRRRGLPDRYILYFGTLEPRKGLDTLLAAFRRLVRDSRFGHTLVLGGARGWLSDSIFAQVQRLGLEDRVLFVGYVPQDEQPLWYGGADVFVYPSRYEGFGFPPLEAMACGTPVVVSNSSSLPEVVGDAGLQVPPDDERALAEAILRVTSNSDLRQCLRTRGLERAAGFTWESTARVTSGIYDSLGACR